MSKPILWIVIPCYNEEQVLPITAPLFLKKINDLAAAGLVSEKSRVLFVNDGSRDATWSLIQKFASEDEHFIGISQSRNRGHQNALLCGLMTLRNRAACVFSLDADLQDDVSAIKQMIQCYDKGCEIVYGVRNRRDTDSFFKRNTALWIYKLMKLLGVELVANHADFRLLSRRAVAAMAEFKEKNLFLRAIVPLVGFKSCCVCYDRKKRQAGTTKYPLKKMLLFALKGISSFSAMPLHLITFSGIVISVLSFILMLWTVFAYFSGSTIVGWASLMSVITFFSGITILFMGIIGEYIASIFVEVKNRPTYIIDQTLD